MVDTSLSPRENLINQDKWLLMVAICLMLIGVLSIYSAGSGIAGRGGTYALRQGFVIAVAILMWFVIVAIGYERIFEIAYPLYAFTIFVLFITLILAPKSRGAQSWFTIGGWSFQPSEFAKISLTLALSKFLSRNQPITLKAFFLALLLVSPSALLVLLQPDFGSTLVFAAITITAILIAGTPFKLLYVMFGLGLAAMPVLWCFLKEYQKLRIRVFLDPTIDPLGAGYNVMQSRIAVGSGGFWGKGFLEGLQSKLRFLPEPHTDFIFSVYSEEFGFFGAVLVLLLFTFLFFRIISTGLKSRDIRAKLLTGCVSSWVWFQMFESIGMSMGLMPVTGLPLPLFSYGGSSLLSILLGLGLISSIHSSNVKIYR